MHESCSHTHGQIVAEQIYLRKRNSLKYAYLGEFNSLKLTNHKRFAIIWRYENTENLF